MTRILFKQKAFDKFQKKTKVYAYFKSKFYWEQEQRYFLFNPLFTFDKNIQIIKDRFNNIEGFIQFFTDGFPYEKTVNKFALDSNQSQLSLF